LGGASHSRERTPDRPVHPACLHQNAIPMLVPCRRGRPAVHAAEEGRPAGRPRLTARSAPSMRVLTCRPGAAPPPQAMERRFGPARCVRPPAPPRPPHGYGCVPPHQAPQIAAGRAEDPGGAVGPREVCGSAPAPSRAAPGRCHPRAAYLPPSSTTPSNTPCSRPRWRGTHLGATFEAQRVPTRVSAHTPASGAANGFRWVASRKLSQRMFLTKINLCIST
jgi:hypothetical protein